MSRLFIIGAGFSKAIANAPTANEFIKNIYNKSCNDVDKYKHSGNWLIDKNSFIKLIKYFHDTVQSLIDKLESEDDEKILNRGFEGFLNSLNVEFICSFLDLNIKHCFIPETKGIDMKGCPIPYIHGFHKSELESALKFIMHHVLDLLLIENLLVNNTIFDKMSEFFREGDNIISFNYDLLIEQMLWKRKLWNPFDGYGFEFERNGNKNIPDTKIKVIKIHGSINWRSPDSFFHPNLELAIKHPFKNEPLFDGLKIPKTPFDNNRLRQYPLYSHIILPTFIKSPQYNWEIELNNNAINLCRNTEEIFIIGYSVPDADYITNILLNEIKKNSLIRIVLFDKTNDIALELKKEMIGKYGFKKENIINENSRIEEWINNDFKFVAYEKYLKEQAEINEIINFKENTNKKK